MVLFRLFITCNKKLTCFRKSGPIRLDNYTCSKVSLIRLLNTSLCFSSHSTHSIPNRLFTDKHEWVLVSGNIGTIGISQYAQDALGDVVYAQLPDVGTVISQHDEVGALESVKAASELYSPVSGKVIEKNSAVEETPALVNQSCYEKGWLFKVELTQPQEVSKLMTEEHYSQFIKSSEQVH